MVFRLADVRKTVRSRSDGERYIHPKLLEGTAINAQVGLALAYFHSRLGRARHEFDPEQLVRFFGDPKVARGLVACLGATYRWRAREFDEVLGPAEVAALTARGLSGPGDLRLHLYDALNAQADGFLAAQREENLRPLAHKLRLSPAKVDQLVALDAEENGVLTRIGVVPQPEHVVALYNFHAAAAMLRHCAHVRLCAADAAAHQALAESCAQHGVALRWEGSEAYLENAPDVFGSYSRGGARLLRAVLCAASAAPGLLRAGRAQVALPGKRAWYLLDRAAERALTGGTGLVHHGAALPQLRESWSRRRAGEGTAGWRLVGAPEPLVTGAGVALAPFACLRDDTTVLLWPAATAEALTQVEALRAAGLQVLAIETGGAQQSAPAEASAIVEALQRGWGGRRADPMAQALEGLLDETRTRGFLPERYVGEALGCASEGEVRATLAGVDPARGIYVVGVGLCSPAFAEDMRKGLRRRTRRKPAA